MRAPTPCLVSTPGGSEPMLRGNELEGACHSECEIKVGWLQKTMENTVRNQPRLSRSFLSELLSREVGTFTTLSFFFYNFTSRPTPGYIFISSKPNHELGTFYAASVNPYRNAPWKLAITSEDFSSSLARCARWLNSRGYHLICLCSRLSFTPSSFQIMT